MLRMLLIYFAGVNLLTFIAFAADKRQAVRGGRRIPEADLILLSAIGGFAGGIAGMIICHHKTRKPRFYLGLPPIMVLWGIVLFFLYRYMIP